MRTLISSVALALLACAPLRAAAPAQPDYLPSVKGAKRPAMLAENVSRAAKFIAEVKDYKGDPRDLARAKEGLKPARMVLDHLSAELAAMKAPKAKAAKGGPFYRGKDWKESLKNGGTVVDPPLPLPPIDYNFGKKGSDFQELSAAERAENISRCAKFLADDYAYERDFGKVPPDLLEESDKKDLAEEQKMAEFARSSLRSDVQEMLKP